MIHVLICCAILGYCVGMCWIDRAASEPGSDPRRAVRHPQPSRPDAAQGPGPHWSALDELQLNRLLRDGAP
jgi:hypothetical protein